MMLDEYRKVNQYSLLNSEVMGVATLYGYDIFTCQKDFMPF